jgi:hypothetical protein
MAKKSTTKAKVKPTYLKAGSSYKMELHNVVRALKAIEEEGHLDRFVRAAKRKKTSVSVDAKTVNFVKDFMVKNNMHDHPVGKHIVNAKMAAADRFRPCDFGK